MRAKQMSPAMAVALLALVAATSGTAVAVTVSRTSLVDAKHPSRSAKVDSTGALKVTAPATVSTRPLPPGKPFDVKAAVSNFYKNGSSYLQVLAPTSSTLALSRVMYTNVITNASAWEIFVYYETVAPGGTCQAFSSAHRLVEHVNVPARESVVSPFPTPVVLSPLAGGSQWCLMAGGGPTQNTASSSDGSTVDLALTGYVVSGTAPTARPSTRQPDPGRLGG